MGKKRNKKAIIITAIVMFIGVLLVLLGIFGGRIFAGSSKDFDYKNIQPSDLGKTVKTDILVYYDSLELDNKDLQFFGENMEDEDYVFLLLDFSASGITPDGTLCQAVKLQAYIFALIQL